MEPRRTPDEGRAGIVQRMPAGTGDREGWARDIQVAFFAQGIAPSPEHLCAVLAVTEQESTFTAEPRVPGLARIAREEIALRAGSFHVPKFVVNSALPIPSPDRLRFPSPLSSFPPLPPFSTSSFFLLFFFFFFFFFFSFFFTFFFF